MKVTDGHRSRQSRRHKARPTPYDLRRKVLTNNFLRDTRSPPKIPSPRLRSSLRLKSIAEAGQSEVTESEDELQNAFKDLNTNDDEEPQHDKPPIVSDPKDFSPETAEFLYLISRRLRISETAKLRQPYRRSPTKNLRRARSSRYAREKGAGQQEEETTFPLRSYPTFDRLNEVFDCDENTMKKTAMFLRKRMNSLSTGGRRSSPPRRSTSFKDNLRVMFSRRAKLKRNTCHTNSVELDDCSGGMEIRSKKKKKDSVINKIVTSVKNNKLPSIPRPTRRSKSVNLLNKRTNTSL